MDIVKNKTGIILGILIVLGFIVRLYRFDGPVADWHSFRQSDTLAVSQIYANEGIDLLYPKYFDISNVQSGFDNPLGYRFVEFPLYNAFQAFLYKTMGIFTLVEWGRLINIIASLLTGLIIFSLVRRHADRISAFSAFSAYLFLPFSIYYSRVILPEITMVLAIMTGIYFFDRYLFDKSTTQMRYAFFILSILSTAVSFLLKPFALFYGLPFVFLAFQAYGLRAVLRWQLWFLAIASIIPLIKWRMWIAAFPEGVPVSDWLFNGNAIRFRPAFFRWIFFERITKLILGYGGIIFVGFGVMRSLRIRKEWFFYSFALSSLIYLVVIATGNVQHDYYQILIIPTIAMFFGIGVSALYNVTRKRFSGNVALIVCLLIAVFSFMASWMQIRDYFNINDRGMVVAGMRANEILPVDAVVIAPYDGSTTLLNIVGRRGWPVFQEPIEELIARGATHLVIANPTPEDRQGFGGDYIVVDSSDEYLILKLQE